MTRRMRANISEAEMRRNQLDSHGDPWDGKTNPHGYGLSHDAVERWYSLRKKCRICHGPVLNQMRVLTCQGCRHEEANKRSTA